LLIKTRWLRGLPAPEAQSREPLDALCVIQHVSLPAHATETGPSTRERAVELDELTLARAQRGDARACRLLVERYQRPVFAVLSRMLSCHGRSHRVEDLAQETFLRVFQALPAFRPDGAARLSCWILTIASRLAIDEIRRAAPRTMVALHHAQDIASETGADAAAQRGAAGALLRRAISALPLEYQSVFILREYHELSYDEIAQGLAVDVGTVKSRLSRARAALRESLKEVAP
jgi:RNA polymerase sigma-70 factor (ECF subfamily)